MAISFLKYKSELVKAWKDVSDVNSETCWAVFGYEGKTYELKVVETGDDLDELVDELSGSKIMYAYCKVQDPNTSLAKFVLVNWVGDGAPAERKGVCARHNRDVANLFRGAHVTINARIDEDVEKGELETKVSKASGANYSFHKEKARPIPEPKPVASVYQRTHAAREIDVNKKDQFWAKQQREDKDRITHDAQSKRQESEKLDQQRRTREAKEASERDRQTAEKMKHVQEIRAKEIQEQEQKKEADKKRWEDQQEEDERQLQSKQPGGGGKAAEAAAMVEQRAFDPKARFEQQAAAPQPISRPPPRKLRDAPPGAPAPMPVSEPARPPPRRPAATPPQPPPPVVEPEPEPEPEPVPEPEPEYELEPTPPSQPPAAAMVPPPVPYRQDSDEEAAEEEDWGEEETSDNIPKASTEGQVDNQYELEPSEPEPVYQPPPEEPEYQPEPSYPEAEYEDTAVVPPPSAPLEETEYADIGAPTPPQPPAGGGDDTGVCARAVYDYQAADESEISFDPEDVITNIEKIDSGWWQGQAPDGSYGMFPSNYVDEI
ncbi:drebrin-like protein B [Glandiceps talaboti]